MTVKTVRNELLEHDIATLSCAILKILRSISGYSIPKSASASFYGLAIISPGLNPSFLRVRLLLIFILAVILTLLVADDDQMEDFSRLYHTVLHTICNHHTAALNQVRSCPQWRISPSRSLSTYFVAS